MKILHEPPQEYIDKHVAVCHIKPRRKHYGIMSRKRRHARELFSQCVELGIEPVLTYRELHERLAELKGDHHE